MNSVVIFGGCGFIGLYLAEELTNLSLYEKIYLVDIQEPQDAFGNSKYLNLLKSKKVSFINADVRNNLSSIDIKDSVGLIVNLAAVHREPGHSAKEYFDTNVNGAKNVCHFADKFNCKNIIFTSSIAVYCVGEHEKDEDTLPQPTSPYGKSQLGRGFWAFLFGGSTNSVQSSSDRDTESKSLTVIITYNTDNVVSDFTYQSLRY